MNTESVLLAATRAVREMILQGWSRDSCVASSKMLCEVLAGAGIEAEPVACSVLIFNEAAMRYSMEGVPMPEAVRMEGGWSVGIGIPGTPELPGRWNGHLIVRATVDGSRYLLDPSIDQASRPHAKLSLSPVATRVDDDGFWGGCHDWWLSGHNRNTGTLCYHILDKGDYTRTPDWVQEHRFDAYRSAMADLASKVRDAMTGMVPAP